LDYYCGRLGLNEKEYWESTARQLAWKHRSHTYLNERSWEQTRILAMYIAAPYSKKTLKPSDIVRLSFDEESSKQRKELIEKGPDQEWLAKMKRKGII